MDFNQAFDIVYGKLVLWLRELIRLLPNIALAALVLVVGFFVAKWFKKLSCKLSAKLSHNPTLVDLFSSFVYIFTIGIALFIALSIVKLDTAVTSILAGAGIVGIALAFAFQDVAANFMAGIFITLRKPIRIGDIVEIKDYMGKVHNINLRDTVIRTFQGKFVIIPNKEVFQNPIENYSLLGRRRLDLTIGVSYGEDLEQVRDVVLDCVRDLPHIFQEEKSTLFFEEFADSSINFSLRIWIDTPDQLEYLHARSEAIIRIKKAFDANDIMIPFPIRTLDFGIKGGKELSEMTLSQREG